MLNIDLAPSSIDGVVAFYSILHLRRQQQEQMLSKIHGWLKEGGYMVLNTGAADNAGSSGQLLGADMFWSSYKPAALHSIVAKAGFQIIEGEVVETKEGLEPTDPDYGVKFH